MASDYIGRYAPSPTGPLHFGSLVAALGSYLQARTQRGRWLLRIENIDPPREVPGAADDIVRTLEQFGFEWDGDVIWQANAHDRHRQAIQTLQNTGLLFACNCSRKQLAKSGSPIYPGTCRELKLPETGNSLRVRVDGEVSFTDRIQGTCVENLSADCGDFVLLRRDQLVAYHLAVVVDDAAERVTEIVRGADLLDVTARQIFLQQCLGVPTPSYCHLPVAVNDAGEKLSKQTQAAAIDATNPLPQLGRAWQFLGQQPVLNEVGNLDEFWQAAQQHWQIDRVPRTRQRREQGDASPDSVSA